jgi:hypothetical protein
MNIKLNTPHPLNQIQIVDIGTGHRRKLVAHEVGVMGAVDEVVGERFGTGQLLGLD